MKHLKKISGVSLLLAVLVALAACNPDPDPGELVLPPGLYAPDGSRVDVEGLAGALDWIAASGTAGEYTIVLEDAVTSFAPRTLEAVGGGSITITLQGYGAARAANPLERVISLTEPGSLFTLNSGVALILGENITLRGRDDNTAPLVKVNAGAALVINDGAKITGNTHNGGYQGRSGGGVSVEGGTLTMTGGEISGNAIRGADWAGGGGIYLAPQGVLSISGGKITGNAIVSSVNCALGGGIWSDYESSVTMSGGEISGNTVTAVIWAGGGGIGFNNSTVSISGGKISGNAVVSTGDPGGAGGGLWSDSDSSVTMSGGEISGNTVTTVAWAGGGGINLLGGTLKFSGGKISGNAVVSSGDDAVGGGIIVSGIAVISGGEISGNSVTGVSRAAGGGIRADGDYITMSGGVISGNTVTSSTLGRASGGGIDVEDTMTFKKIPASGSTGSGTIYGNNAGANSNRAIDPSGEISGGSHAVCAHGGLPDIYITVGPEHHLDTTAPSTFHN